MKEPYYKGYIAAYETYLQSSPYVREVASRLFALTEGANSMLDIGAGTGVFSLIFPNVQVTAVEPSEAMCTKIRENSRAIGKKIRIIRSDWENAEVETGAYDVVLCANSIYQMRPLDDMLHKMVCAARRSVLIVMNGRESIGIYTKMRRALMAAGIDCKVAPRAHTLRDVRRTLSKAGLDYEEEAVSWQDTLRFFDLQDALEHLLVRFAVTERDRTRAKSILTAYIDRADGAYTITDDVTMAFITVR